jgi:hypothetical protein
MTDDFHGEAAARGVGLRDENRLHRRHGDDREDDRRRQRPSDLERRVPVHVPRRRLSLAPAIADHDINEERLDENEDDRSPQQQGVPQVVDRAAELSPGLQRGVGNGGAAGREAHDDHGRQRGDG